MSGSNSICLTTVLLETGMLPMTEPETVVRIDTASGLVTARATCRNGKCERVTLSMNPSYAHELDAVVDVDGFGKVKVDIGYGGIFYALIDPAQFGLEIRPDMARKLVEAGSAVHRAVNKQMQIAHPEIEAIKGISYTMFVSHNEAGELKERDDHAAGPDRPLALRHRQFGAARGSGGAGAGRSPATHSRRARSSIPPSPSPMPATRR